MASVVVWVIRVEIILTLVCLVANLSRLNGPCIGSCMVTLLVLVECHRWNESMDRECNSGGYRLVSTGGAVLQFDS